MKWVRVGVLGRSGSLKDQSQNFIGAFVDGRWWAHIDSRCVLDEEVEETWRTCSRLRTFRLADQVSVSECLLRALCDITKSCFLELSAFQHTRMDWGV